MRMSILAGTSLLALAAAMPAKATPVTFTYTGGIVSYAVPTTGLYDIVAYGAQGGYSGGVTSLVSPGGFGAEIGGDVTLTQGTILSIAVGGRGAGNLGRGGAGGGGGSFVVAGTVPIMIAGGGGGALQYANSEPGLTGTAGGASQERLGTGNAGGTNGSGGLSSTGPLVVGGGGGGGLLTNGTGPGPGMNLGGGGMSFLNGLAGGTGNAGGFGGGGGGGGIDSGGGGGYSGGGGAGSLLGGTGGGGGSYDAGLSNGDLILVAGENGGDGLITLDLVATTPTTVPEPASMALLGPGALGALAAARRRRRR